EVRTGPPPGAPMPNGSGIAREVYVPVPHSPGNGCVTFPAGWHKMPFVVLAGGNALRIAVIQLCNREAFPFTERDFGKPRFHAVAIRRQTEWRTHQRHGFAGASKRARYVVEIGGIASAACEEIAPNNPPMLSPPA